MGRSFGLIAVLIVLAIGGLFYSRQIQTIAPNGASPKSTVDLVAVRNDLIAIANAERVYWVTNSKYGSLEDLLKDGAIHRTSRPDYAYAAETSESGFRIVATYSGADPKAPRRLTIDETMALKTY
jgi:hypothetical protein